MVPPRTSPRKRCRDHRDPSRGHGPRACRPCVRGRLRHGLCRPLAHGRDARSGHAGGRARHRERGGQALPARALGYCHRRPKRLLHPWDRRGRGTAVFHERELRLGHGVVFRGPDDASWPKDRGLLWACRRRHQRAAHLGPLFCLCQDRHHPPPAGGCGRTRHLAGPLLCHGKELQGAHRARPARGGPGGACGRRVSQRRGCPGDARGLWPCPRRVNLRREDPLCPGSRRRAVCPRPHGCAVACGPHGLTGGRKWQQGRRCARARAPGASAKQRLRRWQGLRRPSP